MANSHHFTSANPRDKRSVFVALLFTGRYPRGVFGSLLGINRWSCRVRAYDFLMRDEYPPFPDQGPHEPEQSVQEAVQ